MIPVISIIIPTYNRGEFLLKTINSVLIQTFQDFELIIVDDGSTDNTYQLLSPMILLDKLIYIKQANHGVSHARNSGVARSVGKYIAFLDSDDEWLPKKLEKQIDFLTNNSHLKIVFGEEIWIRNGIRVNQKIIHKKCGGMIFKECVKQCFIAPSSVLIEKKLFLEMNGFDENFKVCEDYDLWLKISSQYEIGFISEPIIIKNGGHTDQLSTQYFAMDLWRLKSLFTILQTKTLKYEDEIIAKSSIHSRGEILMKGYLKHNNENDYKLVKNILEQIK